MIAACYGKRLFGTLSAESTVTLAYAISTCRDHYHITLLYLAVPYCILQVSALGGFPASTPLGKMSTCPVWLPTAASALRAS